MRNREARQAVLVRSMHGEFIRTVADVRKSSPLNVTLYLDCGHQQLERMHGTAGKRPIVQGDKISCIKCATQAIDNELSKP